MKILRITGCSMAPEFQDGDFVVVLKTPGWLRPMREGDTVVFTHPQHGILIKSLVGLPYPEGIEVRGNHPDSVDSRQFGPVPQSQILGRVVAHIRGRSAG